MKHTLYLITGLLLLINMPIIYAGPAFPGIIEYTQPDGSKVKVHLKGDENLNWYESPDGYTLLRNKSGYLEYAKQDYEQNLVLSGVRYQEQELSSGNRNTRQFLSSLPKHLTYSRKQETNILPMASVPGMTLSNIPTTGDKKLLCILMDFPDRRFTKTQKEFENLFNAPGYNVNGAHGSVKDFYRENSWGQLNMHTTVIGPFTAKNNRSAYGTDTGNPKLLILEALEHANANIDITQFIENNRYIIHGVYVIAAGHAYEAGDKEGIWSHATIAPTNNFDDITFRLYGCSSELRGNSGTDISSVGVLCHEIGHLLGAPDYYDTKGEFPGTGYWDIMCYGSWTDDGNTPPHHNGVTKTYIYNWTPATILTGPEYIEMPVSATDRTQFYRIDADDPGEFYLLENRQKKGFDSHLPGEGMLIYHVHKDFSFNTSFLMPVPPNDKHPQLMYVVNAGENQNPDSTSVATYGDINTDKVPFPGSTGQKTFTSTSQPSMFSWLKNPIEKPLTGIIHDPETGLISFSFNHSTENPAHFKSTGSYADMVNLSWKKYKNKDVILAVSTSPDIPGLHPGTEYSEGMRLSMDAEIIYKGNMSQFTHSGLYDQTTYYYTIWSILDDQLSYSSGETISTKTSPLPLSTLPFREGFEEGFATGLKEGWKHEYEYETIDWKFGIEGEEVESAPEGTQFAWFQVKHRNFKNARTKLILPAFDLSSYVGNEVFLEFSMQNRTKYNFYGDVFQDTLALYYKLQGGPWTLLQSFHSDIKEWTTQRIVIPEICKEKHVLIAFEGTSTLGDGVFIDDILLSDGIPATDFRVESLLPEVQSSGIDIFGKVQVKFNRIIEEEDLGKIKLVPDPGGVKAKIDGSVLVIYHQPFAYETSYQVNIPAGTLKDQADPVTWQFITAKEVYMAPLSLNGITVNNGAHVTSNRTVTLNPILSGIITHYMASNDPDFTGVSWQIYSNPLFYELRDDKNGPETIYFKAKNLKEVSNAVSTVIYYKSEPAKHDLFMEQQADEDLLNMVEVSSRSGETDKVTVYPNPAHTDITLDVANAKGDYRITIYASRGIFHSTYTTTTFPYTLNISDLPAGVWIIHISNGKERYVRRILKEGV